MSPRTSAPRTKASAASTRANGTRARKTTNNGDLPNLTSGDLDDMPTADEVRQCMRVIDRFMRNEQTRTAWLVGFLMGSSVREDGEGLPDK